MEKFIPHKIDSEDSFESHLLCDVKAGFPSPAEDIREKLDLIKLLVKHKASTFFFRVSGVSMVDAALDEGGAEGRQSKRLSSFFCILLGREACGVPDTRLLRRTSPCGDTLFAPQKSGRIGIR